MKYTTEEGITIESVLGQTVTLNRTLDINVYQVLPGTFIIFETSSKSNGELQMIEITRIYNENGDVLYRVKELIQEEIISYHQSLNNGN